MVSAKATWGAILSLVAVRHDRLQVVVAPDRVHPVTQRVTPRGPPEEVVRSLTLSYRIC